MNSDESDVSTSVITTLSAQKLMRKGCEAYLAYVLDTRVSESKLEQVPVVKDFSDVFPVELSDVFPEELPGLPPDREVEFGIELILELPPYQSLHIEWPRLN